MICSIWCFEALYIDGASRAEIFKRNGPLRSTVNIVAPVAEAKNFNICFLIWQAKLSDLKSVWVSSGLAFAFSRICSRVGNHETAK